MTRFLSLAILVTLFSCSSSLDERMESLVNGKNLWQSTIGSSDYSFELQKRCYCPNNGQVIRITVEDGAVADVAIVHDSAKHESGISEFRPTLRELFDLVLEYSERELASEGTLSVQYHQALGFPAIISWQGKGPHTSFAWVVNDVTID